ncbi:MAG TPA: MerR family transcriptional regulator [Actinomycetes bacterium]|jgi:DNA-binding transcriptional MerR regulator|nr:MerR family transcriptional regulator [Actinomycetes bacterium]
MAARSSPAPSEPGFRGPTVIKLVGITYRQLDYWARTGLVTPSVRAADGSGTQRLYSFTDVVELRIIKRLLDAGVSLRQIRDAIGYLRAESGGKPLSDVTLMSDGHRIYACHSGEEIVDVLSHGQAVFGIAVGRVWADTEGDLAHLPGDQPAADGSPTASPADGSATAPPAPAVAELAAGMPGAGSPPAPQADAPQAAVAEAAGGLPPRAAPPGTQG